ncbi:hypothetical protein [Rathayibacter rathayi]|uniref:hypothetical protein n=2 Tax=Rathayibacter rathayi TaxID=33887 RepID=UPI0011B0732E|nr:hypothetical protein [Rathayibacter rathayi]
MMKRRTVALAMVTLAIGVVVVPATSASADSGPVSGNKSCSSPTPYVQINSTSKGRINHEAGGGTVGHWNNGSTYTDRYSATDYTSAYWRVFLTGSGGDISYANAVCHS